MPEGELWEGLADASPSAENRPDTVLGTVLNTVSVLSTDLGRLSARLDQTAQELTDRDLHLQGALKLALERLGMVEELAGQVQELATAVADLDKDDRQSPPQPWNWSTMTAQERRESVGLLGAWVRDVLFTRWPWTQRHLHWCWAYHPELLQDLSMLHVAYQQAYEHSDRRSHHEIDFRHILKEVMGSAPEVFAHNDCPKTPAQHRITGPARDDERHWLLASAGEDGAATRTTSERTALGNAPAREPDHTEQHPQTSERDRLLTRLHALNEQVRDHTLPPEHRDQAKRQRAELVKKNDISKEEYLRFRRKVGGPGR
ncbi:hypothetical protein [Nocardiopsis dassonvillei]|uniref:hypothetical protein n=1 Tax=Nocardiopsis dassonvillei TaxID=2014 RepID=UPI003F5702EA